MNRRSLFRRLLVAPVAAAVPVQSAPDNPPSFCINHEWDATLFLDWAKSQPLPARGYVFNRQTKTWERHWESAKVITP